MQDGQDVRIPLDEKLYEQFNFRIPVKLKKEFKIALARKETDGAKYLRKCVEDFVAEANKPLVY